MIEIAWAVRLTDGRIVGVDQVESGLDCGCICSQCREPLIAAKGDIYRHHFRHQADNLQACGGGQETALHLLAKTIVGEAASIDLPGGVAREISSFEMEPALGDIRPDVLLHTPDGNVAVEIAVNHRCGEAKIAKYQVLGLAAVEIDISVFLGATVSYDELRRAVLSTAARYWLRVREKRKLPARWGKSKDWLYHPASASVPPYRSARVPIPFDPYLLLNGDNLSDAWSKGFKAREDREPVSSNPYRSGFDRNSEWVKGWNCAIHVPKIEG